MDKVQHALVSLKAKVLVLTGAGISVAAGIPDYRSDAGMMTAEFGAFTGEDLLQYTNGLGPDPAARVAFYALFGQLRVRMEQATPTLVHRFVASLGRTGRLQRWYTLNVDDLERSVIGEALLVQLHGNNAELVCEGKYAQRRPFPVELAEKMAHSEVTTEDVACSDATVSGSGRTVAGRASFYRPNVVLYGPDPLSATHDANEQIQTDSESRYNVFLCLGTSVAKPELRGLVRGFVAHTRGLSVYVGHPVPDHIPRLGFTDIFDMDLTAFVAAVGGPLPFPDVAPHPPTARVYASGDAEPRGRHKRAGERDEGDPEEVRVLPPRVPGTTPEEVWKTVTKECKRLADAYADNAKEVYGEPTDGALAKLKEQCDALLPGAAFLDIGSGFGRVVFYMLTHGASAASGVELVEQRHDLAVKVAEVYGLTAARLLLGDAAVVDPVDCDIAYSYDFAFGEKTRAKIAAAYFNHCRYMITTIRDLNKAGNVYEQAGYLQLGTLDLRMLGIGGKGEVRTFVVFRGGVARREGGAETPVAFKHAAFASPEHAAAAAAAEACRLQRCDTQTRRALTFDADLFYLEAGTEGMKAFAVCVLPAGQKLLTIKALCSQSYEPRDGLGEHRWGERLLAALGTYAQGTMFMETIVIVVDMPRVRWFHAQGFRFSQTGADEAPEVTAGFEALTMAQEEAALPAALALPSAKQKKRPGVAELNESEKALALFAQRLAAVGLLGVQIIDAAPREFDWARREGVNAAIAAGVLMVKKLAPPRRGPPDCQRRFKPLALEEGVVPIRGRYYNVTGVAVLPWGEEHWRVPCVQDGLLLRAYGACRGLKQSTAVCVKEIPKSLQTGTRR